MKIFKIFIFTILGLFILIALTLETPLGGHFAKIGLVYLLERSGLQIEVGSICGGIPQNMRLQNIHVIDVGGKDVWIDNMRIEIALLPLLGGEVRVETLEANHVQVRESTRISSHSPSLQSSFARMPHISVRSFHIARAQWLETPELEIKGKGALNHRSEKWNLSATINVPTLGEAQAEISLKGTLDQFTGTINGHFRQLLERDWSFKARIQKLLDKPVRFQRILASTRGFRVQGFVNFDQTMAFTKAHLQARVNLQAFSLPVEALGTVFASGEISRSDDGLDITACWTSPELNIDSVSVQNASGAVNGLLSKQSFLGTLEAGGQFLQECWTIATDIAYQTGPSLVLKQLQLVSPLLRATGDLALRPDRLWVGQVFVDEMNLQLIERWNPALPFSGLGSGRCLLDADKIYAEFQAQDVRYKNAHARTLNASGTTRGDLRLECTNAEWGPFQFNSATLETWAQNQRMHIALTGSDLTPLDIRIDGLWRYALQTLQLDIESIQGSAFQHPIALAQPLHFEWSKTRLGLDPLNLSFGEGFLRGSMDMRAERLQLNAALNMQGRPLFTLEVDAPQKGSLLAQGQIEDVLDFFDLGTHRLEADYSCEMKLSGTMAEPQIQGSCRFANGYYQNYLTGTEITHITGTLQAENDRLVLTSFTAQDYAKKGEITASGFLLFSLKKRFPFHFDVDFSRFNVAQIDLIDAEAQGHIAIDGSLCCATVKGRVEILESDIAIPDKIVRSFPDLQVVYKNGSQPVIATTTTRAPYPLALDLEIEAPEGIFISGRGLSSEWKGNFLILGTYTTPDIKGQLDLIHGEFTFASHRFKLTEGSLSLKGCQYSMPIIDISGNIAEQGLLITARLKGPLNHPQITFHSVPSLPLSGILSYLLFGKDLSEINGLQALQLAGTIASIAGEGPDIMEITRKSLGVDRLQIITVPSASGGETVAIQVGKVLTPGIVLTVQQGANDKNPNLGIEADLTHGFLFEAESKQQPEQGKFALKWNLSY